MRQSLRNLTLIASGAGLLIAIGAAPVLANQTDCNSDLNACGELFDHSVSNGTASSKAETFTVTGAKHKGIEVIQNYETHHTFGWTTDRSWTAGSAGDNVTAESATGSFTCSGGTYKFYSHHYSNDPQDEFITLQGEQFSC
jgi:hypothetical protein